MQCELCQKSFTVTDQEKELIDKVSPVFGGKKYNIPLPTYCPDCRLRERVAHRNEAFLYQNKSAKSGQAIIALYSPDASWNKNYKLFSPEEYWQDDWDAIEYGRDFDFSRPFFEQFFELSEQVPKQSLIQSNNVNSPYTTGTGFCKNCHMINCSEYTEDSYYGKLVQSSRDIMDSDFIYTSELLYGCFNVTNCYHCFYLTYSQGCNDCYFSENLSGCKNCLLCTNLVNQEYYYQNKKVTPEEFAKVLQEHLGTKSGLDKAKSKFERCRLERVYKYAALTKSQGCTGDFLSNCKNCVDCYDLSDSEDCRYLVVGIKCKDVVDCSNMYVDIDMCYQTMGTIHIYNVNFCVYVFHCSDIYYCESCWSSKNLFGCVGLRNKQYCIFNKQYTKEEYEVLVPKIIEHMSSKGGSASGGEQTGEWGKFFPAKFSGFGYNESVAGEYLPLTREAALAKDLRWLDASEKNFVAQTYVVPETIKEVGDDVLAAVFVCQRCNKNFKLIKQELERLRQLNLPLTNYCPACRQAERMAWRNPRQMYTRACNKCGQDMQTTFSPNRPERVYCETCYQKEIY